MELATQIYHLRVSYPWQDMLTFNQPNPTTTIKQVIGWERSPYGRSAFQRCEAPRSTRRYRCCVGSTRLESSADRLEVARGFGCLPRIEGRTSGICERVDLSITGQLRVHCPNDVNGGSEMSKRVASRSVPLRRWRRSEILIRTGFVIAACDRLSPEFVSNAGPRGDFAHRLRTTREALITRFMSFCSRLCTKQMVSVFCATVSLRGDQQQVYLFRFFFLNFCSPPQLWP